MNSVSKFLFGTVTRKIVTASVIAFTAGVVTHKVTAHYSSKRSKLSEKEAAKLITAINECLHGKKDAKDDELIAPLQEALRRYRKMDLSGQAKDIVEPLIKFADSFTGIEKNFNEVGKAGMKKAVLASLAALEVISPKVEVKKAA